MKIARMVLPVVIAARWVSGLPAFAVVPYWYIGYGQGFIRRAAVGTLFGPIVRQGQTLQEVTLIVLALGVLATAGMFLLLWMMLRDQPALIGWGFALSTAPSWMMTRLGTLDPWVWLVVLGAVLLLARGRWEACVVSALAPFVHEATLWLLLPALGSAWLLRPELRIKSAASTILVLSSAVALWLFSTDHVAWPAVPGLDATALKRFADWQLGQSFQLYWPNARLSNAALAAGTTFVMLWAVRNKAATRLAALAVLVVWSLAFITVDAEQFLSWGPLAVLLTAHLSIRTEAEISPASLPMADEGCGRANR